MGARVNKELLQESHTALQMLHMRWEHAAFGPCLEATCCIVDRVCISATDPPIMGNTAQERCADGRRPCCPAQIVT